MKKFQKMTSVIIAAVIATIVYVLPVMAESIEDLSFTTPMELEKYKSETVVTPWVMYTGWSSDNGVLKGDNWIEYCYAAAVAVDAKDVVTYGKEAMGSKYRTTPEEIDVKCTYGAGLYSVSDLDKNGWIDYFRTDGSNVYQNASVSSASVETHNGVEFFRIDFTQNGLEEIILYAPSESGDLYSFSYTYKPSTNIAQKFKQDFWDVLDTVSLRQKGASSSSGTTPPSSTTTPPPSNDVVRRGGTKTTTTDDGVVIVEYLWDDAIKIYVNGAQIKSDTSPVLVNGRTMVPIRVIAEKMGYSVVWFEETQTVSMQKGTSLIQLSIGSNSLYKNSNNIIIDVAPLIYDDRTYLPVRAVAEAMGCKVDWNGSEHAVYISK